MPENDKFIWITRFNHWANIQCSNYCCWAPSRWNAFESDWHPRRALEAHARWYKQMYILPRPSSQSACWHSFGRGIFSATAQNTRNTRTTDACVHAVHRNSKDVARFQSAENWAPSSAPAFFVAVWLGLPPHKHILEFSTQLHTRIKYLTAGRIARIRPRIQPLSISTSTSLCSI